MENLQGKVGALFFGVEDTRKASALLTALDWKVYKTVGDLCHPSTPSRKTYEELCEIMSHHFLPRVAVFRLRKNFYELRQKSDETVSQWFCSCEGGSYLCEFGGELGGRIRDNFVTAMKEGKILERVLEETHTSLNGKTYFMMMDACSKWPEVYKVPSMTAETTVSKLRDYSSGYGLPRLLISDNGRQLVSEEFRHFYSVNHIKHNFSATYHLSTNGAAENAVKSFKISLKKTLIVPRNKSVKVDVLISHYLFAYRNSSHFLTGETPSKLMLKRKLRTRFDLIRNNLAKKNAARQVEGYGVSGEVSFDMAKKV